MICDACESFECKVCSHEACPVCEDFCDHPDCIIWNEETGNGRDGHKCEYPPCPNGCVRGWTELEAT